MKLLLILILIINNYNLCLSYECNSNRTYGLKGSSCEINADCLFPEVCFNSVCSKIRTTGESCTKKTDCTLTYDFGDCVNGKCEIIIATGDRCNPKVTSQKCSSSSECKNGICQLISACNSYNCPLNQYCDDKTKQCKPIPNDINSIVCKANSQCPTSHICTSSNKCIIKYSSKVGEKCTDSPLQCRVFNGEICNQETQKCIKNDQYFKQCEDESTCNGGLCVCLDDVNSKSVCVGPNGELNNEKCVNLEQKLEQCLINEKCNTLSPITCKCFKQFECFQYECNSVERFYNYKSNYYQSLNCSRFLTKP
ncbi:hypothetical protein DDB_G0272512 [Dictyostelium discoideum AX4]|uniref:Uncharacterized protein DDB_G0272512 n=1 Tax=Dictyostelium discoideum TaxID=44689 RepID=Y2512_DICDI|nr:hypothetical protein DDB_G0272512 [Dictyostelium discoideum AX4]Q7KWT9.1 RecName: Full=Uncharacterized protein DDB_G0272512; Flags: Precursor [Dictyostelium discoideum]EAL71180.1 hypothetical protein DDB_G0272512 [Dictyostelium discoideum AX4]|eukprot:XP_645127.1 hypothetical protein DDB_G0272512 [Dictyostelium discoideum AX4]